MQAALIRALHWWRQLSKPFYVIVGVVAGMENCRTTCLSENFRPKMKKMKLKTLI